MKVDWTGLRATRCAWCGTELDDRARRNGRADCGACGSATTDPVPDEQSLNAAYGAWYWPASGTRFGRIGDAMLRRSRASVAGRIDEVAPPGPVLDIGAGEGYLVDALAGLGRDASGIDRDSAHPRVSERELGTVEGEFAAIVLWHALEHLPDPKETVELAAGKLLPGGVIVIAVPNYDSLQSRVFGDAWLHLDLPRHLTHLAKDGLESGLKRTGLEPTADSGLKEGQLVIGWLQGLVGLLPGHPDLYQSLRRKSARRIEVGPGKRAYAIGAGVLAFPLAVACALVEQIIGRPGTIYIEATNE